MFKLNDDTPVLLQINFQKVRNAYAMFGNVTDSALRLPSKAWTIENVNNLRNLLDTVRELDIVYQDGEITDEHIRISKRFARLPYIFFNVTSYY